ncbi:hypothetical protein GCM10010222_12900 [Streptomyces tanashiensis]|uniref:AFG1/ZapE family ATPase n=1 Tax=Streptomyces tanashiensis TaxID=67367 RepID=UPI001677BA84|nr:AFG1/ZapE family ATPase [Streptomyces tanashiensis]GGS73407.1 hypothetical protein GCM10010222_12900 [Streptomyces tanashiensis]
MCSSSNSWSLAAAHPGSVLPGVPRLTEADREAAQRFVDLVDVQGDRETDPMSIGRTSLAEALSGDGLPTDIDHAASRLSPLAEESVPTVP